MKKILIFLLPLLLFGCKENKEVIIVSKEDYDKLKNSKEVIYPRPFKFKDSDHINKFDWFISEGDDGHEYLHNDSYKGLVLIHYPECKKCTK